MARNAQVLLVDISTDASVMTDVYRTLSSAMHSRAIEIETGSSILAKFNGDLRVRRKESRNG